MPERSPVPREFDKGLTKYLRYIMSERGFEKRYDRGGFRLVDVARTLKVSKDDVLHAVDTMTHPTKGRRYWSETYQNQIWVGVNWWPDNAGETSLWPPLGGQYFWCPNEWARKEGEGLVEYIQKWFVWERDCPSTEVVQAWNTTAIIVEEWANRRRCVTFHAGPWKDCPSSIRRVDVHNHHTIQGVPSGLEARSVTGVDKRCLMHLMKQEAVALVVQRVVRMVENDARDDNEFAVVCQHGKHTSVAVVMLVLACVYYNAVVAFHNESAFKEAQKLLNWNDDGKREQW